MKIDQRILNELPLLTEDLILFIHSKNKLNLFKITAVEYVYKQNKYITVRLLLTDPKGKFRQSTLDISEDKLIKISREFKLSQLFKA